MIIFNFFKYLIMHIRYSTLLKKIYKEENIIDNLSLLFKEKFKKDWIGRLYVVINPHIINGVYDPNSQIFEYGENGLVNEEYIERFIMLRLNAASEFIKNNNLFDILTFKIKKLDNYDNFLFIIQSITLDNFMKYTKRMGVLLCVLIILFVIFLILNKIFIFF